MATVCRGFLKPGPQDKAAIPSIPALLDKQEWGNAKPQAEGREGFHKSCNGLCW